MSQTGNGTLLNPFTGTVTGQITWNPSLGDEDPVSHLPTYYAHDLTISNNAILTISEGGGILIFIDNVSPVWHSLLTIESGGTFVINPGAAVTVNEIINNGALRLESESGEWGSASLILNAYSGDGITYIELYLEGYSTGVYPWHYISVPISNVDLPTFNTVDIYKYVESLVIDDDNITGWVDYDGYRNSSGLPVDDGFSTLTLGQGYDYFSLISDIKILTTGVGDPPDPLTDRLLNFTDKSYDVSCGSGSPDARGWNLIGNPFTSCLSWDFILSDNFPQNIENAIYFTVNDQVASYVPPFGTNGGAGTIPPMQGFFVHTTGASSVPLKQNARVHNPWQTRFKGTGDYKKSSDTVSFIRLKFENQKDDNDLIVRFNKKATASFDKMFDAYKLNKTNGTISVWTKTGNVDYSINGLPFPETTVEIPVGINVTTAGIYKLSSSELNKLDNFSVTLKDLLTNITVDLKKGGIMVFNAPEGMVEDRFVLTVTNIATGTSDILLPDKKFSIYSSAGTINILSLTEEFNNIPGSVNIYDLNGRKVLQQSEVEWHGKGDLKQLLVNDAAKGLYIVEIKAGNKKYVEKVNLTK
jgi:hypothetical protein